MSEKPREPNVCGRCGATHVEMFMTCVPSCVNKEACELRVKLRGIRVKMLSLAARMELRHGGLAAELHVLAEEMK